MAPKRRRISAAQDARYWREWGMVARVLKDQATDEEREAPTAEELRAVRHGCHARACGLEKSHKELNNTEFSKVLAEFAAIHSPDDLGRQMRLAQQPRLNKLYVIQHTKVEELAEVVEVPYGSNPRLAAEAYIQAISDDQFGGRPILQLRDEELSRLLSTLTNRIRAMKRGVRGVGGRGYAVQALRAAEDAGMDPGKTGCGPA